MWLFLKSTWRTFVALVAVPSTLLAAGMLPSKYSGFIAEYPEVTEMIPWAVAFLFGFLLVAYVFFVDIRRYLDLRKWLPLADAADYFYTAISKHDGLADVKRSFETTSQETSSHGASVAFRRHLLNNADGIILKVRGKIDGGASIREMPLIPTDELDEWAWNAELAFRRDSGPNEIPLPSGQSLTSLEVRKDTIDNYVRRMVEQVKT